MTDEARVILARIEAQVAEQTRALEHHRESEGLWQKSVTLKLSGMDDMLRGDRNTDGILLRLDRVEQREKSRAKLAWVAITTSMSALTAWARKLITG